MAAPITQPKVNVPVARVEIGGQTFDCKTHPEWVRWFELIFDRIGGAVGINAADLEQASADARLALSGDLTRLRTVDDDLQMELHALRGANDALLKRIEALEDRLV